LFRRFIEMFLKKWVHLESTETLLCIISLHSCSCLRLVYTYLGLLICAEIGRRSNTTKQQMLSLYAKRTTVYKRNKLMLIWLLNTTQYCTRICNKASLKKGTVGIYEHCMDLFTPAPNSLTCNQHKTRDKNHLTNITSGFCEKKQIKLTNVVLGRLYCTLYFM
jgi:hypothetical protein